jgi:hypothetical protein
MKGGRKYTHRINASSLSARGSISSAESNKWLGESAQKVRKLSLGGLEQLVS